VDRQHQRGRVGNSADLRAVECRPAILVDRRIGDCRLIMNFAKLEGWRAIDWRATGLKAGAKAIERTIDAITESEQRREEGNRAIENSWRM